MPIESEYDAAVHAIFYRDPKHIQREDSIRAFRDAPRSAGGQLIGSVAERFTPEVCVGVKGSKRVTPSYQAKQPF